ncbi:MAG: hypothetical protein ACFCVE_04165 [Phycisphaerae bacterium]
MNELKHNLARPALRRTRMLAAATLLAGGIIGGAAGCATQVPTRVANLRDEPVPQDPAWQTRNWPATYAEYPSGRAVAGPNLFAYEPEEGQYNAAYAVLEPAVFFGNLALLPFRFFQAPAWEARQYGGVYVPPTHHAMPVLPPMDYPVAQEQAAPQDIPAVPRPDASELDVETEGMSPLIEQQMEGEIEAAPTFDSPEEAPLYRMPDVDGIIQDLNIQRRPAPPATQPAAFPQPPARPVIEPQPAPATQPAEPPELNK